MPLNKHGMQYGLSQYNTILQNVEIEVVVL